jgi:hypothetical protein
MMSSAPSPASRHAATAVDRCSSCGARLRPAEAWCSLCHTAASAESTEPAQDAEPTGAAQLALDPAMDPALDPAMTAVADRLLAELAAVETVLERQSALGSMPFKLSELATGHGAIVLAVVSGVVLLALSLIGLTVLGLLL